MKAIIRVLLDRSGSMSGREKDVVGGVNSFIAEQKKLPDPASIALVRFDTGGVECFRRPQPLAMMEPMLLSDFQPRGGTPLLDAVGKTILEMEKDWGTEQPDRAILVIVTDGEENSSVEFKKQQIKAMIEQRQLSGKWAFIYLGANVDAFAEAESMGVNLSNAAGYKNTAAGITMAYGEMSDAVFMMRSTGSTVAANLGRNIEESKTE